MECLNSTEWFENACDKFALTIADIKKLKENDILEVLLLDRNVWDIALDIKRNKQNVPLDPEIFFRHNKGTYIQQKDLCGKLIEHGVDKYFTDCDFEFHLEYVKDKTWYPLINGHLPINGLDSGAKFPWQQMSPETKVGYRGPMILWSNLQKLPLICNEITYHRPFEIYNSTTNEFLGRYVDVDPTQAVNKYMSVLINKNKKNLINFNIFMDVEAREITFDGKNNIYPLTISYSNRIESLSKL